MPKRKEKDIKEKDIKEEDPKSRYIDNEEFYRLLKEYGKQKPPRVIGDELANLLLKLAVGVSYMNSFINYSDDWKNEMISDALYFSTKYIDRFDIKKYKNPHAYFTTICIRAFKMRIKKEKAQNFKENRFRKEVFEEYFNSEGLYRRKNNEVEDEANIMFTEFDSIDDSIPEIDMSIFEDDVKKVETEEDKIKTIDDLME